MQDDDLSSRTGAPRPAGFRAPDDRLLPFSTRSEISVARTADILDVSRDTVERMIEDGTLQAYKARLTKNSPWRVSYSSVLAHVERLHEVNGLKKRF